MSVFAVEGVSGIFASGSYRLQGLISRLIVVLCLLAVVGWQEMRDLSVGGVGNLRLMHRLGVLDDDGPFSK